MRRAHAFLLGTILLAFGCEDPARPTPDTAIGTLIVDSEPRGGRIFVDHVDTGELTPAILTDLAEGARIIRVDLDTVGGLTYSYSALVHVSPDSGNVAVSRPLTIRCGTSACLSEAAQFHEAGNLRFVVNGAGPLFLFDGHDSGITWPDGTLNSYAAVGMATFTALDDGEPVALGLLNAGRTLNYWAGRPLPAVLSANPYTVMVPAWITPTQSTPQETVRGLEVVQEVTVKETLPNVLFIRVSWTNISDEPLYRLLDPASPEDGVTYTDAWLGFILDVDVGFGDSDDDLVSYSAERNLVFGYDADFAVSGFSGGWSDQPGLIGLMLLEGPGAQSRLNAWATSQDFGASVNDDAGRRLIMATQSVPPNHPDVRIGFAPDDEIADYVASVALGPVTLAPGDSAVARFAVLLAPPAGGTYTSGVVLPAGNPTNTGRPLAATAAPLLQLADSVIDDLAPPTAP